MTGVTPFFIMHLNKRPTWFVKNGIRKPVYYTVDARQLVQAGWTPEGDQQVATAEPTKSVAATSEPAPIASPEPVLGSVDEPALEPAVEAEMDIQSMTKAELIQYAEHNNIEVDPHDLKSTILETIMLANNG